MNNIIFIKQEIIAGLLFYIATSISTLKCIWKQTLMYIFDLFFQATIFQ